MHVAWCMPRGHRGVEGRGGIGELPEIEAGDGRRVSDGGLVRGEVEPALPRCAAHARVGVAETRGGERGREREGAGHGVGAAEDERGGIERDGMVCRGSGRRIGGGGDFGERGALVLGGASDRGPEIGGGRIAEVAGHPGLGLNGGEPGNTGDVSGKFQRGEYGGQSAVAVDGVGEMPGRDEEVEPGEREP